MKEEEKRWQMEKDDIAKGLVPFLQLLEDGNISTENCSKLLSMHILALFEIWKNEQGGKDGDPV
jgi:hypothetical protein